MRKHFLRIAVALATLAFSLVLVALLNQFRRDNLQGNVTRSPPVIALPTPAATDATTTCRFCSSSIAQSDSDLVDFPESINLSPWDIARFIDSNQHVNLEPLWKRLDIKNKPEGPYFSECYSCTTTSNEYDLDNEPGAETLMKLSFGVAEAYRYLVFKYHPTTDRWTLLGHADEWGKYRESEAAMVISDGQTFLLITGQSGSGSGVAFYNNDLFRVTPTGMTRLLSYESEGYQGGSNGWPTKEFSSRMLSCRSYLDKIEVKIEYQIRYYDLQSWDREETLFTKRQVATFIKRHKHEAVVASNSSVTQRELDHIYLMDSMTSDDFLKYNHSELLNLATRGNPEQKKWLRTYLKDCDKSPEKSELVAALRN